MATQPPRGSSPSKFQWPPKPAVNPPPAQRQPTPPNADDVEPSGTQENQIQPPQADSAKDEPLPTAASIDLPSLLAATIPAPRFQALHEFVTDIEHTWLGLVRPTFFDRAREQGWNPDPASVYCPVCGVSTSHTQALDPLEQIQASQPGCVDCRSSPPPWRRLIRLGEYNSLLRQATLELKFSASRSVGRDLGHIMGLQLLSYLSAESVTPQRTLLVPVSASFWRRITRGIDHTLTLARGVQEVSRGVIVKALSRKHRTAQTRLSISKRATNLSGSMSCSPKLARFMLESNQPTAVVLLDDVKTTGATLHEACRAITAALQAAGLKREAARALIKRDVWALVGSVATPRNRSEMDAGPDAQ